MIRFTDILLQILYFFIFLCGTITIIILNTPYLLFLPPLIVIALKVYIGNKKKILRYVKDDFAELGYELLSERPLKFSETKTTMRLYTGVKINDISIERYGYIKKISRVFTAKDKNGIIHELQATVTREWNGSNSIEIKNDKIIPNENS